MTGDLLFSVLYLPVAMVLAVWGMACDAITGRDA